MHNDAAPTLVRGLTRRRGVRQFVKFGIVGASGMVVNFVIAHVLEKTTQLLAGSPTSPSGFMIGGLSNYMLNRMWTFGSRRNPLVEGLQFLTVSAVALLLGKLVFDGGRARRLPPFHHDVVRRDARRHVRQLLPQQVLDVPPPAIDQAHTGARALRRRSSLLAVALRLHGIHNPLLDHPGWRQGDTARSRATSRACSSTSCYPQTSYNGPPPNYVELELQIVPFLAASLYKIFGIHEIFGRLITVGVQHWRRS